MKQQFYPFINEDQNRHIILLGYFGCLMLGCETRVEIFPDFLNYYFRILFQKSIFDNKKYSKIVGQWLLQRFFYGFYFHGLFSGKFVTEVNIPFKDSITRWVFIVDIFLEIWLRSLFSRHYTTHNQSYRVNTQKLMCIMTSRRQKEIDTMQKYCLL